MQFSTHKKLIKQLKKGNEQAYKYLISIHYKPMCDYAFGLARDNFKAEDIVQNVLIKVWEQRLLLKPELSLKGFLFKLVYNEFINQYHKEASINDLKHKYNLSIQKLYEEDSSELNQMMDLVKKEIEKLPPKCKETFLLSKKEGLTYVEIAKYLNVSVKTVENQMSIAYATIRKRIGTKMHSVMFFLFDIKDSGISHFFKLKRRLNILAN